MGNEKTVNVKRIVCLANSRKNSGRCIAGKEVLNNVPAAWIRPVSNRPTHEISELERRYEDGTYPRVLDIIAIPVISAAPFTYQSENIVIAPGYYWVKNGEFPLDKVEGLVDTPDQLWINGDSSFYGVNDRVDEQTASTLDHSLVLIKPERLTFNVVTEGEEFGQPRKKVRASFTYMKAQYSLMVTDPVAESAFLRKPNGNYPLADAYLCISLGEAYKGSCYKLVAAIITKEPL